MIQEIGGTDLLKKSRKKFNLLICLQVLAGFGSVWKTAAWKCVFSSEWDDQLRKPTSICLVRNRVVT